MSDQFTLFPTVVTDDGPKKEVDELKEKVVAPVPYDEDEAKKQVEDNSFKEPPLKEGEIGGFVADRTDIQKIEKWRWPRSSPPVHLKHFWNPVTGTVSPWFDVTLHSKTGETTVSLPERFLHQISLGDWITIHKFVTDNNIIIVKKASITAVPLIYQTMKLDVSWLGPAPHVTGEHRLAHGIDDQDRTIIFKWSSYRDEWGSRLRKRERKTQVKKYEPPQGKQNIGGSYYSTLGLQEPPPPATDEDVKKAYRDKSKETHPDLNPNDPGAGKKFQEVRDAFETLKDEAARIAYDMFFTMATSTFQKQSKGGVNRAWVRRGMIRDVYYPPMSSGEITCSAAMIGNNILVDKITSAKEVTNGNDVRICAMVDGVPTLFWMESK